VPKRKGQPLPPEVAERLDTAVVAMTAALSRLAEGENINLDDMSLVIADVVTVADQVGRDKRDKRIRRPPEAARKVDFSTIIAEGIREQRLKSKMTQAELAVSMARAGFGWKRITVAEIEAAASEKPQRRKAARRVSLEELLALAAIFRVPMLPFMVPGPGEYLAWRHGPSLDPREVLEMLVGRNALVDAAGVSPAVVKKVLGAHVDLKLKGRRER